MVIYGLTFESSHMGFMFCLYEGKLLSWWASELPKTEITQLKQRLNGNELFPVLFFTNIGSDLVSLSNAAADAAAKTAAINGEAFYIFFSSPQPDIHQCADLPTPH